MPVECVFIVYMQKEGLRVISGYPSEYEKYKGIKEIVNKSFPLSASGGELTSFTYGDRSFVSVTVRLEGERPRSGIASIVAALDDKAEVPSASSTLMGVYATLSRNPGLTLDKLVTSLPEIYRAISGLVAGSPRVRDKQAREALIDKATKKFKDIFG